MAREKLFHSKNYTKYILNVAKVIYQKILIGGERGDMFFAVLFKSPDRNLEVSFIP